MEKLFKVLFLCMTGLIAVLLYFYPEVFWKIVLIAIYLYIVYYMNRLSYQVVLKYFRDNKEADTLTTLIMIALAVLAWFVFICVTYALLFEK